MKMLKIIGFMVLVALIAAAPVLAQKKTTKKSTTKKTTQKTKILLPPLEVRAAREKVDIQLSNVNEFLAKLAPLAANLEMAIADQNAGKLKPATSAGIDRARANLVQSIHDIGSALNTLESEFRTKPALSKYLTNVQGITDLAAESEDSASAGQFIAAKDPLRKVAQRLTDTLAVMPR